MINCQCIWLVLWFFRCCSDFSHLIYVSALTNIWFMQFDITYVNLQCNAYYIDTGVMLLWWTFCFRHYQSEILWAYPISCSKRGSGAQFFEQRGSDNYWLDLQIYSDVKKNRGETSSFITGSASEPLWSETLVRWCSS